MSQPPALNTSRDGLPHTAKPWPNAAAAHAAQARVAARQCLVHTVAQQKTRRLRAPFFSLCMLQKLASGDVRFVSHGAEKSLKMGAVFRSHFWDRHDKSVDRGWPKNGPPFCEAAALWCRPVPPAACDLPRAP